MTLSPFALAFIVTFFVAVTIAATTARRATRRHGGTLNQLAHEVRALIYVRLALGLIFYAALIAWLFWPGAMSWMYVPVPGIVRWIAVWMMAPALAFFWWAFRSIGTNYRGGVGLYAGHELVTTGAYRWMRHPIYTSFIVIMLLLFPLSANWVLSLAGLMLVVSIVAFRIPIEERELRDRFGAAWQQHQAETGSLFPRIR